MCKIEPMEILLSANNLCKSFKNIKAVDNLSFEIKQGEVFAMLGPNGAGKSTTLRMILDILKPDSGNIQLQLPNPMRHHIGYLPEDRGLYPDLPILRTLMYFGQLRGMSVAHSRKSAIQWLTKTGLVARSADKLLTLSKGNQQKVQFISAILHKPAFAILDEPFSGLDPVNQELFIDFIRQLQADGITVLLSSHQMALVEKLADRLLLLHNGKQVFAGTLDQLRLQSHTTGKLFVRFAQLPDLNLLSQCPGATLAQPTNDMEVVFDIDKASSINAVAGWICQQAAVVSIRSSTTDLHDIFLQMIAEANKK